MKFISLFAAIGGLDLGLERAGMECAGYAEIDKHAAQVFNRHFPGVKNYGDVRNVTKENTGAIDLICGGFPCQDVSLAGKRAGLAGKRSGMWYEFHRIIAELRPRWVVIENVPGLLSSNGGRDMGAILGALAKLRYGYAYRVLDAQYLGVAQRRRRVFIVANSTDWHYPAQVLFEPESCERHSAPSRKAGERVAGTITARAGKDGAGANGQLNKLTVSAALTSRNNRLDAESQAFIAFNWHRTNINAGEVAPTITNSDSHAPAIAWHNHQQDGSIRVQNDISPTVSKHWGTGGNNVPFVGVRRLTPTECERLQGFPDGWTAGQSDTQRYKQLGNAVCVNVAEWFGLRIMEVEGGAE